jgi:hypothetical protein
MTIIDRIAASPEGGTLHAAGWELPAHGFWVGGAGPTLILPDVRRLEAYGELVRAWLQVPADSYIGWWTGPGGRLYRDGTTWVPSARAARLCATVRAEIAYYDIRAGVSRSDHTEERAA